jgi:acyl-CoA synthetase (AMP-forming)/AMP-acid ligase II
MSFGAALAYRAEEQPDDPAFMLLDQDGEPEAELTFGDMHRRAQSIAALLLEKMPPASRALLLFPPGIDYACTLYGCFQAGVVAVSAPPPQPNRLHRTLPRLQAIAADAEISAVLTTDFIKQAAESDAAESFLTDGPLTEVQWIATDTAPEGGEAEVVQPNLTEMAFLQYTSGSTREPRGVVLSHENLLRNSDLITDALEHVPNGIRKGLSWLPPYHDMGLIAGVLQPVHSNGLCIVMNPLAVIKRPARWLEAMTKYRVTTSGGPNFAYDLCVRRIDDETCERLDLSEWEVAFNGAEPIRAETIEAFCRKFGPCGFKRETFLTGYGLAEATLGVTTSEKGKGPRSIEIDVRALEDGVLAPPTGDGSSKTLISSGSRLDEDSKVIVVNPEEDRTCREGEVGEIWFAGPGVAQGYWRNPEETAEVFDARLPEDPETSYMRTGDLGALVDGELYVVGRIKELIIVNGRNIHPHDIEFSAEAASPLLRSHCGAAFEQEVDGEIRIGLLLEVGPAEEADYDDVLAAVRKRVAEDLDLPLYWVGLCPPGTVPKTTSGKIQRRLCKSMVAERDVGLVAEYPRRES